MEIKTRLEMERNRLKEQIKQDRREMRNLPDKKLEMRTIRGKRYLSKEVRERGMKRFRAVKQIDYHFVQRVRRKRFLKERVYRMEIDKAVIDWFLERYEPWDDASIWEAVPEAYRLALTCQKFKGLEEDRGDHFLEEHLIHTNSIGEGFRSKAEMQISEILRVRKIDYLYEPVLYLGEHRVRPDFKMTHPKTGKAIYIEYFGMIGNEDYTCKAMEKIYWYLENGYIPNVNVIFLMETPNSGLHLASLNKTLDMVLN
ncbi:MAG: hypothetical protein IJ486_06800 [Firmicutes bacterium]|nr:hypothetical protein [Bacillota bacterium]